MDFKVIAQDIYNTLRAAKSVLLHFHPSPDPDSVGSTLAMKHVLEDWGVKVTVIRGDSPMPTSLSCFPGFKDVVDKNFTEIDLIGFDLFLILDVSQASRITSLAPVVFPPHLKTILIDHHQLSDNFAQINLVDPTYSSTSELLYCLLKEWGTPINRLAATCMYGGIWADTGGFKYPSVLPRTLLAAAGLAELTPDFSKLIFELENNQPPEQIYLEGLILNSVELYGNGRVALAGVSYQMLEDKNLVGAAGHIAVSNKLKSVIGWDIGVTLVEKEPGAVSVSMRTRDAEQFDLSKLAVALGGGGHKAAAGILIRKPFVEAKKLFLEKLVEVYPVLK